MYAYHVINGPWEPGEEAIASSACYAYQYARNVIKNPWPPGEKAIASDPRWKQEYEQYFKVKL